MTSKYIIFLAQSASDHGWEERIRRNAGHESLTKILAEHFYSADQPNPKVGDRLLAFVKVPGYQDAQFPDASTHMREGDWEVVGVEEYTPEIPVSQFAAIVICTCRYVPIASPLEPLPPIQVSADSFGDEAAHQSWQEQQKVSV